MVTSGSVRRWAPYVLSILRIAVAFMFIMHGTRKLFGVPTVEPRPTVALFSQAGLAGILEVYGGIPLMFGLFTRPLAFLLSGEMAFAYWLSHAPRSFWPVLNGGDSALLMCFVFLYLAAAGGGPWSLDRLMRRGGLASPIPAAWAPYLLSVLRIMAAFAFLLHGTQKLFGMPVTEPRPPVNLFSLIGLAGVLEGVGGPLLMVGLLTRPLAFLLSGEMAVAYFMSHAPRGFWPVLNNGEPAALYAFIFLYIAAAGGGAWSLDRFFGKRRE